MKRFNKGFTLAEVLITLAIIAVIATLGFTITRKGIERAYDNYIYTGISNLSNAIADAKANGITDIDDFYEHVRLLMNASGAGSTIIAPNGIRYTFEDAGTYGSNIDSRLSFYKVTMTVPTKKTSNGNTREETFIYVEQSEYPQLIPYDFKNRRISDLANRVDLLAYYVDDGKVGRKIPDNDYTAPVRVSFKQAACEACGEIRLENSLLNPDVFIPKIKVVLMNFRKNYALYNCDELVTDPSIDSGGEEASKWETESDHLEFEQFCGGSGGGGGAGGGGNFNDAKGARTLSSLNSNELTELKKELYERFMKALLSHEEYFEFGKVWMDKFEHPKGRYTEITNTNKLVRFYDGCDGGKTGFTELARRTLVTTASKDHLNLVIVTLNDGNDFLDHKNLYEEAFEKYKSYEIVKSGPFEIYDENYYGDPSESYYPMTVSVMNADNLYAGMYMEISLSDNGGDSDKDDMYDENFINDEDVVEGEDVMDDMYTEDEFSEGEQDSLYLSGAFVKYENGGYYVYKEVDGVLTAKDELTYNENEIRRIAIRAFDIAMKRNKKVISVDKANVLDSSRLWRKVVEEVAKDYPEVSSEHMLVDNCAMQLVKNPAQFDVILTENMFGDILSDEASMVTGSIGMLSSASLNETKFGLYEPSGGSAPDIAGMGIANPIATILSAAMMLRYSFDLDKEADAVEAAVKQVLKEGYRTGDIMPQAGTSTEGITKVGTAQMGSLIAERV